MGFIQGEATIASRTRHSGATARHTLLKEQL
jgi:hypothetical protein